MKRKSLLTLLHRQPWHWYTALIITLVAGFLRLYRIPDNVMFLGDQGRDALIVARIFKEGNPVLIGPVTSVGNLYLGPLYYYFMLPFLWISYPSPLGPVYAVAILSTLTVFLTYFLGKKMFSPLTGLLASFFLAFGANAIELSRFSWNPNLAPLLSLLMIFFCWKALKKPKNWLWVAILFSAIIQLHYLALLSGVSAALIWLYSLIRTKLASPKKIKPLLKYGSLSLLILLVSLSPLVAFDIRHGRINQNAFYKMFAQERILSDGQARGIGNSLMQLVRESRGRAATVLVTLQLTQQSQFQYPLAFFLLACWVYLLYYSHKHHRQTFSALLVVGIFLIVGILGAAAYKRSLYVHYIAYLIPVSCFVMALMLRLLLQLLKKRAVPLVVFAIVVFIYLNLPHWPLQANNIYHNTKLVAKQIEILVDTNDRYEIVLLSETRDLYGQSYRYFLSTTNNPPVIKESGEPPNTLIIIDEEKKVEDVTALPIYEIQVFPSKEIDVHLQNNELPDIYLLRKQAK